MSTFDISAYLNSKNDFTASGIPEMSQVAIPEMVGVLPIESPISKAAALLEASRQKAFDLEEQIFAKRKQLREQNAGSVTTMFGLDYNGVVGAPVNALAGGLDAARRMFTESVVAPFSLGAQSQEEAIDPKSMDILKRKSAGAQITFEEEQWINTPTADIYDPLTLSGPTPKQLFEGRFGYEGNRRIATEFRKATDTSSLVNNEAVGLMQQQLIDKPENAAALKRLKDTNLAYWKAEDLGTLIKGSLEAGGNNPLAVVQLISENLPQIALGMVNPTALVTSNIGYAQTYYDKWSENFAAREGREPTLEEKKAAQTKAWSLAAAETLGDLTTVGATKSLKASLGVGSKAVNATTPQALKQALGVVGDTLPGRLAVAAAPVISAAAKATGKVLGASGSELVTEGYQTNTESVLETGKNASAEDIYFGATAGALASGGITSIGAGTGLAKDVFSAAKEVKAVIDERKTNNTEIYKSAVETGDITPLINNPDPLQNKWVDAAEALTKNAEGKSEEDIKNTIAKIDAEIVSKLQSIADNLLMDTDEKASVLEPKIKEMEDYLADNVVSQKFKDRLARYKAQLAEPVNPGKQKNAYKFRAKLLKQLDEVVGLREGLNSQLTEGEAGVIEAARAIAEPNTTEGTEAPTTDVPKLIARAMKIRGNKSQELADALDAVADLGIATPEETKTLRILSAEIVASNKAKDVKGVTRDVYYGEGAKKGTVPKQGLEFKGVFKYQDAFNEAFAKNNTEAATKEFDGLTNFLKSHTNKLAAYKSLEPSQMVAATKSGNWKVFDIPKDWDDAKVSKFFEDKAGFAWTGRNPVHKGLQNTIAAIEEEMSVMTPVLQKMSLELGKPINTPALKPEGNVSVQEAPKAKQTEEEKPKVSKPVVEDKGTKPASTGEDTTTSVKPTEEVKPKEPEVVKPVEDLSAVEKQAEVYEEYLNNPDNEGSYIDRAKNILAWATAEKGKLDAINRDGLTDAQGEFQSNLNRLIIVAKEKIQNEEAVAQGGLADAIFTPEQLKAINETQDELFTNKTESTAEVTTQGESQGTINDTAGTGSSINEDSDKFDDEGQAIEEDKRYTSKRELLKRIKQIRESIKEYMDCVSSKKG